MSALLSVAGVGKGYAKAETGRGRVRLVCDLLPRSHAFPST